MEIKVFTSKDCHSCHPFLKNMEKVAKKFPGLIVKEYPVEKYPQEAGRFWVKATPTAVAVEQGRPINTMRGAYPLKAIEEWIRESIELTRKRR